jgi:ribosomal protein L11 methyltransferase
MARHGACIAGTTCGQALPWQPVDPPIGPPTIACGRAVDKLSVNTVDQTPTKPDAMPPDTAVARLATDGATAQRIANVVAETFEPDDVAASAFEDAGGQWTVSLHFGAPPDEAAVRALVALAADPQAAAALTFGVLPTKDWVRASLDGLAPVPAGRFVVHGSHDRAQVPPSRTGIEIEAALAFGTGHHGTTRGCLLALDRLLRTRRPRRVLDVGTGTGVLAIAAARALRRPVLASDIDRRSVLVARENAAINRAGPLVEVIHAAGLSAHRFRRRGPFDLVMANILLVPLKRLAAPMAGLLDRDATVILSGLLPSHANAALAAYRAQGLTLRRRLVLDGWVTLVLQR